MTRLTKLMSSPYFGVSLVGLGAVTIVGSAIMAPILDAFVLGSTDKTIAFITPVMTTGCALLIIGVILLVAHGLIYLFNRAQEE